MPEHERSPAHRTADRDAAPIAAATTGGRRLGVRDALGLPVIVLGASFVGYGSLIHDSQLGLGLGLFATASNWALPSQVATLELLNAGASLVSIVLAVALINLRFLPMTVVLMPLLHAPTRPRWQYYLAAHLVALTGWAAALRRCPGLPPEQRLPYFVGFSIAIWLATLVGTAAGYLAAGSVPHEVSLGLVFLNPIYFLLLLLVDLRVRVRVIALALGAVLGPLLHQFSAEWGLILTGVIGGAVALLLDRLRGARGG